MAAEIDKDEITQDSEEIQSSQNTQDQTSQDNSEATTPEDLVDDAYTKKKNLIKKILIIVIGTLLFIIVLFTVLFLTGFFDPESEDTQVEQKTQQTQKAVETKQSRSNLKTMNAFDVSKLNTVKLNKELERLTSRNLEVEKKQSLLKEHKTTSKT